jgi:ribose transport system permease protein
MTDTTTPVGIAIKTRKFRSPALGQLGLPLVIIGIAVVTSFVEERFRSVANLQNLLRQMAPLQILAVGQLFAVLSGGLDLSVAAVMALSGVCGVLAMGALGLYGGLAVMLIVGCAIGLINGWFVVAVRVSPLIVTLGMLSVAKGIALILAGGVPLYDVPNALVDVVGFGEVWGIPVSSLIAFALMIIASLLLRKTVFGRHVYAIGSSINAARNSGLPVSLRIVMIYGFSGLTAGIAAIVTTAWVSSAQPTAGDGLELQSLAAVVVGGVALTGGSGTMGQAFMGVLLLALLSNALNMAGVSSFLQVVVIGLVILLSVVVDRLRSLAGRKTTH